MFKSLTTMAFAAAAFVAFSTPASADKVNTAQDLVKSAIEHYEEVGYDQALASFNDADGDFVEGEFYVIVANTEDGTFYAHPINSALIDNPAIWDLRDVNGVYIIRDMVETGQEAPDGGWSNYVWTHPETKKLTQKRTWVEVHDDLLFMVGFYEEE